MPLLLAFQMHINFTIRHVFISFRKGNVFIQGTFIQSYCKLMTGQNYYVIGLLVVLPVSKKFWAFVKIIPFKKFLKTLFPQYCWIVIVHGGSLFLNFVGNPYPRFFVTTNVLQSTELTNLTKVRHLFTLSHRGSDNSPLLIVFMWTLYELCLCIYYVMISTNQIAYFKQCSIFEDDEIV